jgi:antitoxin ParD1/3/4
MHIALTPELQDFVERQLKSGMYETTSELVHHALKLLLEQEAQREAKLEALRQAVQEGMDSGQAQRWNAEDFIAQMKEEKG